MPAAELPSHLAALIRLPAENREAEYKRTMNWREKDTRLKVVKAALGFSNIPDGGRLVLGVREEPRGVFHAEGMKPDDFDSFWQDEVSDEINEYADPSMGVGLAKGSVDGSLYVVVQIPPFCELPTLCKRDGGAMSELRRGAIYTRSVHKPETAEVRDQTEMREIMDRATMLSVRKMRRQYPELFERPGPEADAAALGREPGGFL